MTNASKTNIIVNGTRKVPFSYGPVKVSTGILKQDKRGVPSNHEKGSILKLNADNTVAMAA